MDATPTRWLNRQRRPIQWLLLALCLLPASDMLLAYLRDDLGINGFETLIQRSGRDALLLLLLTLAITPLRRLLSRLAVVLDITWGRRLCDWNWLVSLRRLLGLASFAYASLHAGIYLHFELDWSIDELWLEISERYFLAVGLLAYLALIPLAITSTDGMMRRMKKHWRRLHRLIYPVALAGCLHFWLQSKPGESLWLVYTLVTLALLGYRIRLVERRVDPDGLAPPRNRSARTPVHPGLDQHRQVVEGKSGESQY
ncbi:MAG TPA: sulfoxide reductase heme-binding subunit YedZ, partial [Gammaproteobacteria bacterium]|nr:sulfoxide reductase heme-binding subunit YedZ [Gammaproteobacteria bacterium]